MGRGSAIVLEPRQRGDDLLISTQAPSSILGTAVLRRSLRGVECPKLLGLVQLVQRMLPAPYPQAIVSSLAQSLVKDLKRRKEERTSCMQCCMPCCMQLYIYVKLCYIHLCLEEDAEQFLRSLEQPVKDATDLRNEDDCQLNAWKPPLVGGLSCICFLPGSSLLPIARSIQEATATACSCLQLATHVLRSWLKDVVFRCYQGLMAQDDSASCGVLHHK